jgi:hypothetical protein
MKRRESGATLAFVAGSIIFIVILALGFYFLSQLLGGGRELQQATNSGTLNVAKQAVLHPQVAVPSGNQTTADMKEILLGVLPADQVNLLNFNRMVGSAMLVAINAEADGNSDALGDARTFIDLVEGQDGGGGGSASAGQALRDSLANGAGWAKKYFDDTAGGNNLRMLGESSGTAWEPGDFQVGYYSAGQPTNITLNNFKSDSSDNLPFNNIAALCQTQSFTASGLVRGDLPTDDGGTPATKKDTGSGDTLLLGYKGLNFGSVNRHVFAVPLDTQPHLVSLQDFGTGASTAQPGLGNGPPIIVPPNAFMNGAKGKDQRTKSNRDVHMLAAAMAGTNQRPFEIGLPYGYIVLDNHLSQKWQGLIPNGDTVFVKELGSPGISVDSNSGYFERADNGELDAWHQTPRDFNSDGTPFKPGTDGPAWDTIFTKSGDAPASKLDVNNAVPYNGSSVTCNHSNSDATSPGANSNCVNGTSAPSPNALCPFDKAFHPNRPPANSGNPLDLTAAEQTGCKVMDLWQKATANQPYNWDGSQSPYTGIGLYPAGHNPIKGESVPWSSSSHPADFQQDDTGNSYSDPNIPCKVTKPGNFAQYVDQTVGGTPDPAGQPTSPQAKALVKIIKQRMHEILPASDSSIDAEFSATALKPIPLGTALFIYLDPASSFKKFKSDTNPPPWLNKGNLMTHVFRDPKAPGSDGVDGKDCLVKNQTYGVAMTMADAKHQFGIHDTPFIHVNGEMVTIGADPKNDPTGNGSIKATDEVYVNANTGSFGNLLNVSFQESTKSDVNVNFTDRD